METKLDNILFKIQSGNASTALVELSDMINKLNKKKQGKDSEKQYLQILKIYCLTEVNRIHNARQEFNSFLDNCEQIDQQLRPAIIQIISKKTGIYEKSNQLILDHYNKKTQQYKKGSEDWKENMYEIVKLYVNNKDYEQASKVSSQIYLSTQDKQYLIQYLIFTKMNLQKQGKFNKENLKMTLLFITKLLKDININEKYDQYYIRFAAELYSEINDQENAIKLLEQYPTAFNDNFKNLEYLSLMENSKIIMNQKIDIYKKLFQDNICLDKYQMQHQKYLDFFYLLHNDNFILEENQDIELFEFSLEFSNSKNLNIFINSMIKYLDQVISQESHKFFRQSMKSVLSFLLHISKKVNITNRNRFLSLYIKIFRVQLTLDKEINNLINKNEYQIVLQEIKLDIEKLKDVDRCIAEINFFKLQQVFDQYEHSIDQLIEIYIEKYQEYYKLLFQQPVKKGERNFFDDFVILAAQLLWSNIFIEKNLNIQNAFKAIFFLEIGFQNSQYNYNIQLLLIQFYEALGNTERIMDIYKQMDVKGVQYETIAYIYFKAMSEYNLQNQYQDEINKALQFYSYNETETKKMIFSSLKKNFENYKESFEWDEWLENSYTNLLHLYSKIEYSMKNEKISYQDIVSGLENIYSRLSNSKQLNFSVDFDIYQPLCSFNHQDKQFWNYYGNLQNISYLKCLCQIQKLVVLFQNGQFQNIQELQILENSIESVNFQNSYILNQFKYRNKPQKYIENKVNEQSQQYLEAQQLFESKKSSFKFQIAILQIISQLSNISNQSNEKELEFSQQLQNLNNIISSIVAKDGLNNISVKTKILYDQLQNIEVFSILKSLQLKDKFKKIFMKKKGLKQPLTKILEEIKEIQVEKLLNYIQKEIQNLKDEQIKQFQVNQEFLVNLIDKTHIKFYNKEKLQNAIIKDYESSFIFQHQILNQRFLDLIKQFK